MTREDRLTPEELAAIRERADRASDGPWEDRGEWLYDADDLIICEFEQHQEHNAEFIAHAREDIPRLLDEIERLQRVIEALDDEGMFRLGYVEWDEIWQGVRERLKECDAE